jgi:uncharacterized protein YggE
MSRIGVGAVLFLALLGAVIVVIELVSIPQMYSVQGEGKVKYRPDAARIHTSVVARAEIANDASIEVAATMKLVLAALKEVGVSDADMATASLKQWPVGEDHRSKDEYKGFLAAQSVVVTLLDTKRVAAVTGAISTAGSNDWSVEFYSTKEKELEVAARKAAVQDAIARADAIAAEGNFKRGRILKVVESDVTFPSADYDERDFDDFGRAFRRGGGTMERITVTAQRREGPDFLIPEPQELTVKAEIDVLFELN